MDVEEERERRVRAEEEREAGAAGESHGGAVR